MSILIFLIVLSTLIVVHEFGHFAMAKSLGVKVEKFAIGFGPKLFSRTFNGTEFALCLVPLGGYVKMAGDERSECNGSADEYYSHAPGHRSLIVLAGPVVNYLLAFLCFWLVFVIGYPAVSPTVGELIEDFPAQHAGLQTDDTILKVDGEDIESWDHMQKKISTSKDKSVNLTIRRGDATIAKTLELKIDEIENIFGQKKRVSLIGIRPQDKVTLLKYNVFVAFSKAARKLYEVTSMTYTALYSMATGAMSAKDSVTGPIGIFYIIKKAASMGFSYLLYIMAVISASLAIFNLLPLPVLDGGHLFFLAIERIRRKALSEKIDEFINRLGLGLIICLAVFVFYTDFSRFGWIDKIVGMWQHLGF